LVLIQDPRLRADRFIVRAQSGIRADGPPSAQVDRGSSSAQLRNDMQSARQTFRKCSR
jgi:hypothetical protein